MPDTPEERNARVTRTTLREDGAGLSVYFPKEAVDEWGLEAGDDVSVVRELGDDDTFQFSIEGMANGFGRAALVAHADEQDWVPADSWDGEDRWSETFYTPDGSIRLNVMDQTVIDGHPLNNVNVETCFGILSSLDEYRQLLDWVEPYDHITIEVNDSENIWARYASSIETGDIDMHAPDPESLAVVYNKVDAVGVRLEYLNASAEMTLDDLQQAVNTLSAATEQFDILPTEGDLPE